jgi:hypothetical protein
MRLLRMTNGFSRAVLAVEKRILDNHAAHILASAISL